MESGLTIAQKTLLAVLYSLIVLMIVFSVLATKYKGKEVFLLTSETGGIVDPQSGKIEAVFNFPTLEEAMEKGSKQKDSATSRSA